MANRSLSIEDGNLNSPALITSRQESYTDVDLSFNQQGAFGDIYKKIDAGAVRQSIKNLLLTNLGERPFLPNYGADLRSLLFDLADPFIENEIRDAINLAIENYEPRARVQRIDVNVAPDSNSVSVSILFQIINTNESVTLETNLARIR